MSYLGAILYLCLFLSGCTQLKWDGSKQPVTIYVNGQPYAKTQDTTIFLPLNKGDEVFVESDVTKFRSNTITNN